MSFQDSHWGRPNKDNSSEEKRHENKSSNASDKEDMDQTSSTEKEEGQQKDGNRNRDQINGVNQDIDALWGDIISTLRKKVKPQQDQEKKNVDLTRRDDFEEFQWDQKDSDTQASDTQQQKKDSRDDKGRFTVRKSEHPGYRRIRVGIPKKYFSFAGKGVFLALVAAWAATGFYIVPEGQTGVVTQFGKYFESTPPGLRWHLPMPIQSVRLVDVSRVRTVTIGGHRNRRIAERALMLTDDENIVDVQFTVQYRIKPMRGAREYLFNTRNPEASIIQTAESAMREVVGRKAMDSVLFESKAEIAMSVQQLMQEMLDRYATGLEVMSVAIQNAQPPAPVQAAFNDAVKAGQDRERAINLGEAYMNAVLPQARGTASRLTEEAAAYKARVVETARGDAARFKSIYDEYKKAPQVTRDRLYIDTMRDVYKNVSKVVVDTKNSNPMLYVPLDQLVKQTQSQAQATVKSMRAVPVEKPITIKREPSTPNTRRSLERFRE